MYITTKLDSERLPAPQPSSHNLVPGFHSSCVTARIPNPLHEPPSPQHRQLAPHYARRPEFGRPDLSSISAQALSAPTAAADSASELLQ